MRVRTSPLPVETGCAQTLTFWDDCYSKGSEQPNLNTQTSQSDTGHFQATKDPFHISCCTLKGTQNDDGVCGRAALLSSTSPASHLQIAEDRVIETEHCKMTNIWKKEDTEIQRENFTHLLSCQYRGSGVFCQEGIGQALHDHNTINGPAKEWL